MPLARPSVGTAALLVLAAFATATLASGSAGSLCTSPTDCASGDCKGRCCAPGVGVCKKCGLFGECLECEAGVGYVDDGFCRNFSGAGTPCQSNGHCSSRDCATRCCAPHNQGCAVCGSFGQCLVCPSGRELTSNNTCHDKVAFAAVGAFCAEDNDCAGGVYCRGNDCCHASVGPTCFDCAGGTGACVGCNSTATYGIGSKRGGTYQCIPKLPRGSICGVNGAANPGNLSSAQHNMLVAAWRASDPTCFEGVCMGQCCARLDYSCSHCDSSGACDACQVGQRRWLQREQANRTSLDSLNYCTSTPYDMADLPVCPGTTASQGWVQWCGSCYRKLPTKVDDFDALPSATRAQGEIACVEEWAAVKLTNPRLGGTAGLARVESTGETLVVYALGFPPITPALRAAAQERPELLKTAIWVGFSTFVRSLDADEGVVLQSTGKWRESPPATEWRPGPVCEVKPPELEPVDGNDPGSCFGVVRSRCQSETVNTRPSYCYAMPPHQEGASSSLRPALGAAAACTLAAAAWMAAATLGARL